MTKLKRKSFYLYEHQYKQFVDHVYITYATTGRRITESEVIRDAFDLFFTTKAATLLHQDFLRDGHENPI